MLSQCNLRTSGVLCLLDPSEPSTCALSMPAATRTWHVNLRPLLLPAPAQALHRVLRVICSLRVAPR